MDSFSLWIFFAFLGISMAIGLLRVGRSRRRWRELADHYRGRFSGGWFRDYRLELDVDGIPIAIRREGSLNGPDSRVTLRGVAHMPDQDGPTFSVQPRGAYLWTHKTGEATLETDPVFDKAFIVLASDIEAARKAWSPEAQRLMLRLCVSRIGLVSGKAWSDGKSCSLSTTFVGVKRLETMLPLLVALAKRSEHPGPLP